MVEEKKKIVPFVQVDTSKVEDMQRLTDDLKELDRQELAYVSGAIQMAKLLKTLKCEVEPA